MKCPVCGAWNRSSMPVCAKCGEPLPAQGEEGQPSWKRELHDERRGSQYYRMDEEGHTDARPDERDVLATEMEQLKLRKESGAHLQRKLRSESRRRGLVPTGMQIRSNVNSAVTDSDPEEEQERRYRAQTGGRTHIQYVGQRASDRADYDDLRTAVTGTETYSGGYDPMWEEEASDWHKGQLPQASTVRVHTRPRPTGANLALRVFVILLIAGLAGTSGYFGYHYYLDRQRENREQEEWRREYLEPRASVLDEQAAHTILIPGTDGQTIYIRELHTSYEVRDGYATIQVADHTWYDDKENLTEPTMEVTLTPFLKTASGRQQPLDVITYTINIPLSPITMLTPETNRTEVATSMYTLEFEVRPGSKVTINGTDISDTVNAQTGAFSYNYTVQPIGDNNITVKVRSQYCRENSLSLVLYRKPQEVTLDLAVDTFTSTSRETMQVRCSTLPGATVDVLSPYTDLDVTNLNTTGEFSFYARFDHIGNNDIEITSSFPGKETSYIRHTVYYVPSVDIYTRKAWPLWAENVYSELLNNIEYRAAHTQVFVVKGVLQYFVSEKPQMAVFNSSEDDQSRPVVVQNHTKMIWKKGQFYRMYADAYGTYDNMPWLNCRFSYDYDN